MTDRTGFLSQPWYTLAHAIAGSGVNADMDKMPETIAKSVNRRGRAELKRLGRCGISLHLYDGARIDEAVSAFLEKAGRFALARSCAGCAAHRPLADDAGHAEAPQTRGMRASTGMWSTASR